MGEIGKALSKKYHYKVDVIENVPVLRPTKWREKVDFIYRKISTFHQKMLLEINSEVSVVMVTYNGERYIKEQLLSIVNQTKRPSEIIIVDDASTDNTVNLISDLAKKSRIKIKLFVNQENMGACKTFNKALLECSGDLIFLADQDDFWYQDKIEKMVDIMILDTTIGCCICDVDLSDSKLNMLGLSMNESVIRRGRRLNDRVMGAAACYRSNLIDFALPILTRSLP